MTGSSSSTPDTTITTSCTMVTSTRSSPEVPGLSQFCRIFVRPKARVARQAGWDTGSERTCSECCSAAHLTAACQLLQLSGLQPGNTPHLPPPSPLLVLPLPWQPFMSGDLLADGDIRLEFRNGECITANIGTCLSVEISRIFPDFRLYSKQ